MATANDEPDRLSKLEQQVQRILERLDELGVSTPPGSVSATASIEPEPGEAHPEKGNLHGSLTYSGSVRFGQRRLLVQERRVDLSTLLNTEPEAVSRVFAAFGSPFRILLLRVLLEGPRTSQQLHEVLHGTSLGLLYHHLKDLVASGLVVQPERSVYAIAPRKMMAICLAFVAASHLLTAGSRTEELDAVEPEDELGHDLGR